MIDALAVVLNRVLQPVCNLLNWWLEPDKRTPIPCPYCPCMNRLEPYDGACQYYLLHPDYAKSGGDPPCLCDSYASINARHLNISF